MLSFLLFMSLCLVGSVVSQGDLCYPNPCGSNAICRPGYDNTGKDRPVCACPSGFIGNALVSCQRGECASDSECSRNRICTNARCEDPCIGACGINADCRVDQYKRSAVCSCPRGTVGHPFSECRRQTPADLCYPNPCGANAECRPGYDNTGKDRPVCTCFSGYIGDPLTGCRRGVDNQYIRSYY